MASARSLLIIKETLGDVICKQIIGKKAFFCDARQIMCTRFCSQTVITHCLQRDDFFMLVETSDGQPIKVYVYSSLTDGVRELTLTPNSKWGGEGM